MRQPLVVGVRHEKGMMGCLLDGHCREAFKKDVLPRIGGDTLLLLEGDYRESYHHPRDPLYSLHRSLAELFLGVPINSPVIGWRDPRQQEDREMRTQSDKLYKYIDYRVAPRVVFSERAPRTFVELCDAFVHSRVEYTLTEEFAEYELARYCVNILDRHARFDAAMIAAACKWGAAGCPVIIVCGGLHALTIHRETSWPTLFLAGETPGNVTELVRAIITDILYPEKVLGVTPSVSPSTL